MKNNKGKLTDIERKCITQLFEETENIPLHVIFNKLLMVICANNKSEDELLMMVLGTRLRAMCEVINNHKLNDDLTKIYYSVVEEQKNN